jgi:hypothetical protein
LLPKVSVPTLVVFRAVNDFEALSAQFSIHQSDP